MVYRPGRAAYIFAHPPRELKAQWYAAAKRTDDPAEVIFQILWLTVLWTRDHRLS